MTRVTYRLCQQKQRGKRPPPPADNSDDATEIPSKKAKVEEATSTSARSLHATDVDMTQLNTKEKSTVTPVVA